MSNQKPQKPNPRNADQPKPGPEPERLKADGVDWEEAVRHALNKPKPKEGWPDEKKPKGKKK